MEPLKDLRCEVVRGREGLNAKEKQEDKSGKLVEVGEEAKESE